MTKSKLLSLICCTSLLSTVVGQQNPFLGTWKTQYNLIIDGGDTTKIKLANHQQFVISILADSFAMYYAGNKILTSNYELKDKILTADGVQLTKINENTIHQTDILGKVNLILKRYPPPKYTEPPAELLAVWFGESRFLTNQGDTVDYTADKRGYNNNWTVGFDEKGKMHTYLPGMTEMYSSDYKLKGDTIFFVKPYVINNETYYHPAEKYYIIRKLDSFSLVYGEDNLGEEFLNGFRKLYSRKKSVLVFEDVPKKFIGNWSGAYSYLMRKKDTIRMSEGISILGMTTESTPTDTTNTAFYQFLSNHQGKYIWRQDDFPSEFRYQIKSKVLNLYKFPIQINGETQYMGLDSYPIKIINDSTLTLQRKSTDGSYRLNTFVKSEQSLIDETRYIIGSRRNGQKLGIWGLYHENNNLKQIIYYWDAGFDRLGLNFDRAGKYIEPQGSDQKVVRLEGSISFTDENESYVLLLQLFENGKPRNIEYQRDGKLLLSIAFNENSEIIAKKWFDLNMIKYRED